MGEIYIFKTFFLAEYGIFPNSEYDVSDKIQDFFNSLPDNSSVHFKPGKYKILKPVEIKNHKLIKILGNGATIISHFDPCGKIEDNNNVFLFENCSDFELNGFNFDTDAPIGATGTVTQIDFENKTVDLEIDEEFPVTGYEHICATNSFDSKGSPDYALATYNNELTQQEFTDVGGNSALRYIGLDYEVFGERQIRLKLEKVLPEKSKCRLKIGHKVNIRYEIYGNSVLVFTTCQRANIKNINIYSAASFGVMVKPRSADFIFENFNIFVPASSKRLKAINADGIHILGLSGKLTLKNCNIEGLGDDVLNIHGLGVEVTELDTNSQSMVISGKRAAHMREISRLWAAPEDKIYVYDPKTFLQTASFTVDTIDNNGNLTYKDLKGTIENGDVLANAKFFAKVHIDGCTFKNTRARGILIQSHNVLIENCYIGGMSLAGMLFAPDIKMWWEVGPTKNIEIRNNVIEYCASAPRPSNRGAIVFKACHGDGSIDYPAGVHDNIYIHGNRFIDINYSGIFVSSAKNVKIKNNYFNNCCCGVKAGTSLYDEYDIVAINCENLCIEDNQSSRGDDKLVYCGFETEKINR